MQQAESIARSGPPPEVTPIHWARLDTALGLLHVAVSPVGVVAVGTTDRADDAFLARMDDELGARSRLVRAPHPVLDAALDELVAYFAGRLHDFTVPLDWRLLHGDFNRRVLTALRAVPWGHLVSYSEMARRVGAPRAARAV